MQDNQIQIMLIFNLFKVNDPQGEWNISREKIQWQITALKIVFKHYTIKIWILYLNQNDYLSIDIIFE